MTTLNTLQYPADLPKYYMTLDIQSYSRANLFTIGVTQSLGMIVLPLPAKLVDTQQVKYEEKPIGSLLGAGLNAGLASVSNFDKNNATASTVSGLAETGKGLLAGGAVNITDRLDSAVPGVGSAVKAVTGYSGNYFLTVLLDGPQYKTHNFQWQFSPRTPQESESLNKIIRTLNNAMAPGLQFSGAVFTFPRVFRIAYQPNVRYLYKFKPAVLVNFTVDYSGGGLPAFYRADTATSSHNAPVMLTINAQFLELEFWLRSDFGDNSGTDTSYLDDPTKTTGPRND